MTTVLDYRPQPTWNLAWLNGADNNALFGSGVSLDRLSIYARHGDKTLSYRTRNVHVLAS